MWIALQSDNLSTSCSIMPLDEFDQSFKGQVLTLGAAPRAVRDLIWNPHNVQDDIISAL